MFVELNGDFINAERITLICRFPEGDSWVFIAGHTDTYIGLGKESTQLLLAALEVIKPKQFTQLMCQRCGHPDYEQHKKICTKC